MSDSSAMRRLRLLTRSAGLDASHAAKNSATLDFRFEGGKGEGVRGGVRGKCTFTRSLGVTVVDETVGKPYVEKDFKSAVNKTYEGTE